MTPHELRATLDAAIAGVVGDSVVIPLEAAKDLRARLERGKRTLPTASEVRAYVEAHPGLGVTDITNALGPSGKILALLERRKFVEFRDGGWHRTPKISARDLPRRTTEAMLEANRRAKREHKARKRRGENVKTRRRFATEAERIEARKQTNREAQRRYAERNPSPRRAKAAKPPKPPKPARAPVAPRVFRSKALDNAPVAGCVDPVRETLPDSSAFIAANPHAFERLPAFGAKPAAIDGPVARKNRERTREFNETLPRKRA